MALPPAQPEYIFRGHAAQIHAVFFIRENTRLLTGDAHGWVVSWDTAIRRPVAVWKAHDRGPILGLGAWGKDRIITCVFISSQIDLLTEFVGMAKTTS